MVVDGADGRIGEVEGKKAPEVDVMLLAAHAVCLRLSGPWQGRPSEAGARMMGARSDGY
jgi:hypothetical protein